VVKYASKGAFFSSCKQSYLRTHQLRPMVSSTGRRLWRDREVAVQLGDYIKGGCA
jgi:hypothetical protein